MLNIDLYVHALQFPTNQVIKEETIELNKEEINTIRPEEMLLVEVKEEEKETLSAKFSNYPDVPKYQWTDSANHWSD